MHAPPFETSRFTLDPLVPADAEAFFEYRALPEVTRFQTFAPQHLQEAQAFVERQRDVVFGAPDSWFQLAIRDRATGALVGDVGLHFLDEDARTLEVGISVAPSHHRRGIAREVLSEALSATFRDGNIRRVIASVDPRNTASMALFASLGMRKEAHFRESLWFKGEWVDDVIFAMLRAEWPPPPA